MLLQKDYILKSNKSRLKVIKTHKFKVHKGDQMHTMINIQCWEEQGTCLQACMIANNNKIVINFYDITNHLSFFVLDGAKCYVPYIGT